MTFKPFAHQKSGAEWLSDRDRGYLADPPGMGKTNTVLLSLIDMGTESALVACPAIVCSHWHKSAEEVGYSGDLFVLSYEKIVNGGFALMSEMLMKNNVDTLVADEAHYCKHPTSQRTKIIMGKDGYARRVERAILASGTPMPKNPQELFTQLCYLAPDVLLKYNVATMEKWTAMFCITQMRWIRSVRVEKVVGVRNAEMLKALLDEVMLRREGGVDLPELWWQTVRLNTEKAEWQNWELGEDAAAFKKIADALRADELESIANDPEVSRMRRRLGELKVKPVVEMLASQLADSTEKVAVFADHTSVLTGLREGLAQYGVAFIDGSVSASKRDAELVRFQDDPRCRVFIGQNTATGTGFDGLQYATNRGILVEPDWTAKNNVQLGRRLARTGQTRGTTIMQMVVLADTLDDSIVGVNIRETKIEDEVFGKVK